MYEVNTTNPLGTKGVLALRFGELCKEVSFVELNFISASLKFSAFNFILINFIFLSDKRTYRNYKTQVLQFVLPTFLRDSAL